VRVREHGAACRTAAPIPFPLQQLLRPGPARVWMNGGELEPEGRSSDGRCLARRLRDQDGAASFPGCPVGGSASRVSQDRGFGSGEATLGRASLRRLEGLCMEASGGW
jgi:hypothetical protein